MPLNLKGPGLETAASEDSPVVGELEVDVILDSLIVDVVLHGTSGFSNLLVGCSPWQCHTLAADSESSNLAAAAAALVAFRIGPSRNCQHKFTISYSNHGPNLL